MSHDAKKYASYFASDLARAFGAVEQRTQRLDEDYSTDFNATKAEQNHYGREKANIDRGFVQHGIYF